MSNIAWLNNFYAFTVICGLLNVLLKYLYVWPDTKNEVNEKSKTFVDMETQTDSIKFVDVETQTETIKKKKLIKKFWNKGKEKSM